MLNDCSNKGRDSPAKKMLFVPQTIAHSTVCGWNLKTFEWRRRRVLHVQISRLCSVTQSCLTLCNPMNCSHPGASVHGILQARKWVGCHALFQGIFPTQGQNSVFYALAGMFFTTSTTWEIDKVYNCYEEPYS